MRRKSIFQNTETVKHCRQCYRQSMLRAMPHAICCTQYCCSEKRSCLSNTAWQYCFTLRAVLHTIDVANHVTRSNLLKHAVLCSRKRSCRLSNFNLPGIARSVAGNSSMLRTMSHDAICCAQYCCIVENDLIHLSNIVAGNLYCEPCRAMQFVACNIAGVDPTSKQIAELNVCC